MRTFSLSCTTLLAAGLTLTASVPLAAQTYPTKPVHIVAPFVPGGPVDIMARILSEKLSASMGTTVIVENRPGAGGNVGAEYVARAAADGHTLLLASGSILTMNEAIYPTLNFSPSKDLAPITVVGDMPLIVAIHADVPAKTLKEFVSYAEKRETFFSSPGNGTTGHAATALLNTTANTKVTHVPYKGGSESARAVLTGMVTGAIDTPPSLLPHIRTGKVRALAVAGPSRLDQLPDVPTTTEAGMPDLQVLTWFALVAPAATPPQVIDRINKEVRQALALDDVKKRFDGMGIRPAGNTPQEFASFAAAERNKWVRIIQQANIRIE
jgi:tripartite-type tricarboxylate transporter receptor subunit TctC